MKKRTEKIGYPRVMETPQATKTRLNLWGKRRAELARESLSRYEGAMEFAALCALVDLMHLCNRTSELDFNTLVNRAAREFESEV